MFSVRALHTVRFAPVAPLIDRKTITRKEQRVRASGASVAGGRQSARLSGLSLPPTTDNPLSLLAEGRVELPNSPGSRPGRFAGFAYSADCSIHSTCVSGPNGTRTRTLSVDNRTLLS